MTESQSALSIAEEQLGINPLLNTGQTTPFGQSDVQGDVAYFNYLITNNPISTPAAIAQAGFSGTVSIPNTTWTPVNNWAIGNTVDGPIGIWGATGFTIALAGWYDVTSTIQIAANAGGTQRLAGVFINGTVISGRACMISPINAGVGAIGQVNTYVKLNVGDLVSSGGFQDSGGAVNLIQAFLELKYVGT